MKIVVALAACALAATAQAAGLGRLTVLSALGQPLLAEIEIVALQAGEDEGLSARLPPLETFASAGIDVNPALSGLRISIERRDKRPLLRLTTAQPINEPFLDLLVELSWNSGKLVREYTFLLDPPDYRSRQQQPIAQAPQPPVEKPAAVAPQPPAAPQAEPKPAAEPAPPPAPAAEAPPTPAERAAAALAAEKPDEQKPAGETPVEEKPAAEKPATPGATSYEVKRGDTLGAIAKQHLRPGITLNQMLIAIFRANEDAFIRGNVNLVRTGKILNIPDPDTIGTLDRDEVNRVVKEHQAQFNEYRSRLAAVPTTTEAGQQGREVAGSIEKPEAPKPPPPADQLRLSKSEPAKPGAQPSPAAREDDAAARQRALQEAQSRISELERNVADQQKLLAMRNQQLAEMEKKGAPKPAAEAPKPAAQAPKPAAEAPKPAAEAPKPVAEAPKPAAPAPTEAPKPTAEISKPAAEAPKPAPEAPKPGADAPKPAPKPVAKPAAKAPPPPPEPSLVDEFLDNPMYLALLGGLVLLLVAYGWLSWRRKKKAHAKFQDSVLGAAASGAASGAALSEPTASAGGGSGSLQAASTAPAGMEAEEVDPIAEADVYMAYGRDAQAEEILKEALQKDSNRVPVHAKLLEIYAHRKDTRAFEQTALKLKNLTNGAGPEWEKAAALGRSIDPENGSYAGGAAEVPAAAVAAPVAAAPMLDFDLGGAAQSQASVPDISLDDAGKSSSAGLDFDLGSTQNLRTGTPPAPPPEETVISGDKDAAGGLDFNLDLGAEEKKQESASPAAAAPKASAPDASGGLDFDLNLDIDKAGDAKPAGAGGEPAKVDLSTISLDLGASDATVMGKSSGDPKWQEVATKLDLAKAYEEMGDKDGARELLKEVMKDGDVAQRGSAEQLLAKLG